ncbi:MAG: PepSY domain-containing protein [Croceibacterium sp.]
MMRKFLFPLVAGAMLVGGLTATPVFAQQKRGDQESARKEMRAGNVLTLREIERMVVPQIERDGSIQYLTPEFDEVARAYRLKFIDNSKGQVIWVDVDGRTGRIMRISR